MRLIVSVTALLCLCFVPVARAQVTSAAARDLGLELAWQSQIQFSPISGVASVNLWADSEGARQFAEITLPNQQVIRVSADQLDRDGAAIGIEKAKTKALQQAIFRSTDANGDGLLTASEATNFASAFAAIDRDRDQKITYAEYTRFIDWLALVENEGKLGRVDLPRMLKSRGLQNVSSLLSKPSGFEVRELTVPSLKLILVSRDGKVTTLDAETGKLIWENTCGDVRAPAFPAAICGAGVVVLQGEHLYEFDLQNGKLLRTQPLGKGSSNAVAVTNTVAFVSDFSGRVVAYPVGEGEFKQKWGYTTRGRAVGKTLSLLDKNLCAIASADGVLYVFHSSRTPEVWLRYQSTTPIAGCIGAGKSSFYVGTEGGKFSKIVMEERNGRIDWEYLSAHSFSSAPLIIGSQIFAASDSGTLISLRDSDGSEEWSSNALNVREPLSVVGDTVYCVTRANELVSVDRKSGIVLARAITRNLGYAVANQLNDRLYCIGSQGQVQCLRPFGSDTPRMITASSGAAAQPEAEAPEATNESETPMSEEPGDNPFGGNDGNDPFGGGMDAPAEAAPEGADPFSADSP